MRLDLPVVKYTMPTEEVGAYCLRHDFMIITVLHFIHIPQRHLRQVCLHVRELTCTRRAVLATPGRILEHTTESKSGPAATAPMDRHDPYWPSLRA